MDREGVITDIARVAVLLPTAHYHIGVILPTFSEVKRFHLDLLTKFTEVPKWLMPPLDRCTIRSIEFTYSKISLMSSSPSSGKGCTFNTIYMSSRLSDKEKSKHIFTLIPAVSSGKSIITFDDH